MLRIAVLVSGGSTNLQAIMDSLDSGAITNAQLVTVISNNANAYALKRAEDYGVEGLLYPPGIFRVGKTLTLSCWRPSWKELSLLTAVLLLLG